MNNNVGCLLTAEDSQMRWKTPMWTVHECVCWSCIGNTSEVSRGYKTGLSYHPHPVFLLSVPRRLFCYSSSLYLRLSFHTRHLFRPYFITKTYLYNFDPLKPHFYIVKIGFTGVNIFFFYFCSKLRLCVLVRTALPRRF